MSERFKFLREGLNDIIEHQKGKEQLRAKVVKSSDHTLKYSPEYLKRIREWLDVMTTR